MSPSVPSSVPSSAFSHRPSGSSRWPRRLGWLAAGWLLVWALGWLVLPPVLRHQAEKHASEALGREVRVGRVDFRPWSLELEVRDLSVAAASGGEPQLQVARIHVNAELESLFRLAPVVQSVTVESPTVRLKRQGDGRYDVDDMLNRLRRAPESAAAEPARFALYNLRLSGGTVVFDDQPVGKVHRVDALEVAVPFLSNLDAHREVHTEPLLALRLNGVVFDTRAQSTPFARTQRTDATLRFAGLDLTPYLAYLPADLPVRLTGAVVDADLRVNFEQVDKPVVRITGKVAARDVALVDPGRRPLLEVGRIAVSLSDLQPLARQVDLESVEVEAPSLTLARARDGRLLMPGNRKPDPEPSKKIAISDENSMGIGQKSSETSKNTWKAALQRLALRDGRVNWTDESTVVTPGQPSARLQLREGRLEVSALTWPLPDGTGTAARFDGSAVLAGPPGGKAASGASAGAALAFAGTVSATAVRTTATLADWQLAWIEPYVAQALVPRLGGKLAVAVAATVPLAADGGTAEKPSLRVDRLRAERLELVRDGAVLASVRQLDLADAAIDPVVRSVSLGRVLVDQPRTVVSRDAQGEWMAQRWLRVPDTPAASSLAPTAAATAPAWKLDAGEIRVVGGALQWRDEAARSPVAVDLSGLQAQLTQFSLGGARPVKVQLAARVHAPDREGGAVDFQGLATLSPVTSQGKLVVERLPVHLFEPYFGGALNVDILRADTGFRGQVEVAMLPAGPRARVSGDLLVEDFQAHSAVAALVGGPATCAATATAPAAVPALGEDLLSWKMLSVRGVELSLAPGQAMDLAVAETALDDFYARVILNEQGRLNLQDMVRTPASASTATAATMATTATTATVGTAATGGSTAAGEPTIRIGPVSLVGGRVAFSDRFIKPNYSANLTELTGRLGGFSTAVAAGTPQLADLELRGRAEGTAALEILGKVNPLARPLALDIQGKVRDLELAPLSPYSVKYAGHGIERGKLSVDVAYRVQPDGQLTASNAIVLNQLSFGDKVEGAPASLPVKLAVALLADRNGVIDINLPVSGSLNDPQFRIGPIIFKLIVNLVVKAITAPFSLLAGALGGGDELSQVSFAPGSAALGDSARAGLDKVAQALAQRPGLRMTVVGTARLDIERDGLQRERLDAMVRAEKRRALVAAGLTADTSTAVVTPAEYPQWLKAVYRRADIPKPRNLVGLARDLPVAEMEALLLASLPVEEEMVRELATRRGVVVRDYLASRQISPDRLFLGAPRTAAAVDGGLAVPAAPDAAGTASGSRKPWSPHAELSLGTR